MYPFRPLAITVFLLSLLSATAAAVPPFAHFEKAPRDLSWIDTYLLSMVSDLAYRSMVIDLEGDTVREKFHHAFKPLGLEVFAFLESHADRTDTQALVLRNDEIVLVAFSGSEIHDRKAMVRDWLRTDASVRPVEFDGLRIHGGFHRAIESIWQELLTTVEGRRRQGLEVWLTGHSLGGALASLAAYRLSRAGIEVAGVYTFASPKVGDTELAARFERLFGTRSQQWTTALDPITRLPELGDRTAYVKLGVTNMVYATGEVDRVTDLSLPGIPDPLSHRMPVYINYLYRALPDEVRRKMPPPPPLCATGATLVGTRLKTRYPICLADRIRKIRRERCLQNGGEVEEPWCLFEVPGKYRYRARKLRDARASGDVTSPEP